MRKLLLLSSFGFKYGLPQDSNYVFDVRFIPNPFYVAELKSLSGMDGAVQEYIRSSEEAGSFLTSSMLFLDSVIPRYFKSGREFLHVAVGCTGGRHRSVAFAEWLCGHYKETSTDMGIDFSVELSHRDVDKASEA